jgi:hypothetical protein
MTGKFLFGREYDDEMVAKPKNVVVDLEKYLSFHHVHDCLCVIALAMISIINFERFLAS